MSAHEPKPDPAQRERPDPAGRRRSGGVPPLAVVGIAVVAALLVWLLLLRGDDDTDTETTRPASTPEKTVEVVSEAELAAAVGDPGYPVYWAGPRAGVRYEVTRIRDGRTYIRYLPEPERAGSPTPLLTVGSYEQADSLEVLGKLARDEKTELFDVDGGGKGFAEPDSPTGVYVAFPGANTQIEVFDPEPGAALELVESGLLVPLD